MPEVRYFRIIQAREVKVSANDPLEAAQIADAVFEGRVQKGDLTETHIISPIRVQGFLVEESR